ncbi:MAG: DUF2079 domain-containing protein, partial [Candidatus Omnitrophica bacterium]|nr:DUF2079 domain-containing protein [Candidatus Omnitrophota bacterium]
MSETGEKPLRNKHLILWVLIIGYILIFSFLTIRCYNTYNTRSIDLAIYDQVTWGVLQGQPQTTIGNKPTFLTFHLNLILFPLALFYWLWSDVRVLLILQSIGIGLGGLAVFHLAEGKIKYKYAGLCCALIYFLYFPLEEVNLFDFHPVSLVIPFLLFGFLFLERRRYKWAFVFMALAISCRETTALVVAMTGIYYIVKSKKDNQVEKSRLLIIGLMLCGLGLIYFAIVFLYIKPFWQIGSLTNVLPQAGSFADSGQSNQVRFFSMISAYIKSVFSWDRLMYIYYLLMPLMFISLFSLRIFFISLPILGLNLLGGYQYLRALDTHYSSEIIPFVIISAVYGVPCFVSLIKKRAEQISCIKNSKIIAGENLTGLVLIIMICSSLTTNYFYGYSILSRGFNAQRYRPTQKSVRFSYAVSLIPDDASVSSCILAMPHLSQRKILDYFPCPQAKNMDYILVDFNEPRGLGVSLQEHQCYLEQLRSYISGLISGKTHEAVFYKGSIILIRRIKDIKK